MALIAVTRSWDLMSGVVAKLLFTPRLGSSNKKVVDFMPAHHLLELYNSEIFKDPNTMFN